MRVGVLTWFRDANYGTVLQALALQKYLKKAGHEAQLINYIPARKCTRDVKLSIPERALRKFNFLNGRIFEKNNWQGFEEKRKAAFKTIDANCKVTRSIVTYEDFESLNDEFDAFICGSDQVWNPYWLDGKFFLDFVSDDNLRIAYAPSLGISAIPSDLSTQIRTYLEKFNSLSVRERSAAEMLKNIVSKDIQCVCDPVFLLNKEEWVSFAEQVKNEKRKYVFFYFLSFQPSHWKAVKKFARKKNLDLIGIPVFGRQYYLKNCIKYPFASPEQFVCLIANAEYVVTDSFHVTSFSILFNKQFFTFERFRDSNDYSQNSRVNNLLDTLDLRYRLVAHNSSIIAELNEINYVTVNNRLKNWVADSQKYLLASLEIDEGEQE